MALFIINYIKTDYCDLSDPLDFKSGYSIEIIFTEIANISIFRNVSIDVVEVDNKWNNNKAQTYLENQYDKLLRLASYRKDYQLKIKSALVDIILEGEINISEIEKLVKDNNILRLLIAHIQGLI